MPVLFISHGSPMLAIVDSPARRFLQALGPKLPRPDAIVIFSAHHDARVTQVTGAVHPETIHDFGGFPRELYEIAYAAPGDPTLAQRIVALLGGAAIDAVIDPDRGLDHGAWIPLALMFPQRDVPVVQVSIDSRRPPEHHLQMGRALRALREENVLIVGSGGATHNLALYARAGQLAAAPEFVEQFNEWVAAAMRTRAFDELLRYRESAPFAPQNHPSPEHFLPIFAAVGAAFDDEPGVRIHHSYDRELVSLDCYAFGFDA